MTRKEQRRRTVDELTEAEAADTLGYLARRRQPGDALGELLATAPLGDEPTTPRKTRTPPRRCSPPTATRAASRRSAPASVEPLTIDTAA